MPYRRPGSKNLYITVKRPDGRSVRRSAGTDNWDDATALEGKLNHEAWEQRRMGVKPSKRWREAVVRWLTDKAHKSSIHTDRGRLAWLDRHLGHLLLSEISRELVDQIMQSRPGVSTQLATPQNRTANHFVSLIGWILNAAEREWEWGNRAPRLRTYPVAEYPKRSLTVEEWLRLEKELPPHLRRLATFSLSTGLREGKVFSLRWPSVDLARRSLSVSGTKNKLGVSIPLNSVAMSILQECRSLPVVHADYVFIKTDIGPHSLRGTPSLNGHNDKVWNAICQRAGIGHLRYHDLRSTFVTWLYEGGAPEWAVRRLAGHTTKTVHEGYNRADIESLRPYSEIIDRVLEGKTKGVGNAK